MTDDGNGPNGFGFDAANGEYDDAAEESAYQSSAATPQEEKASKASKASGTEERDAKLVEANKILMPTSAAVSFSVKGWLASGIKVESLNIDFRKSTGLGEGVKPVKGAKYLTVSKNGVETRC